MLLITLFYGIQIEKISSLYFLVFYSFFTSLPFFLFLLFIFKVDFFFSLVFFDLKLSSFYSFLVSVCFLVKFPVYFLHYWLPKIHVEAPTLARMLLAGLLLKFGVFGFFRIYSIFKLEVLNIFFFVAFLGIIIGMFLSLVQRDLKRLVAYSSICHISFTFLSFFYFSDLSKLTLVFSSLRHGFLRTLVFWFVGEIYYQSGTRMIYFSGSLYSSDFFFIIFLCLVNFLSSSVPLGLGYFSEYGLFLHLLMFNFFYFFYVVYFFMDFYISVYLFVVLFIGKKLKVFNSFLLSYSLGFLLLSIWVLFFTFSSIF